MKLYYMNKVFFKKSGLLLSILFLTSLAFGQKKDTTITFKVWGNCEMCKRTIETALEVKGVKDAAWDKDTKMISITYNPEKITEDKIHQLIAASGYDTEKTKGDDKAYQGLPHCCQYQRKQP